MAAVRRVTLRSAYVVTVVAVWLGLTLLLAGVIFTHSSREVVLAGHDSVLRPTLERTVEIRTGPVLPDLRIDSGKPLGVNIYLGKTDAESTDELISRYALIASNPDGSIAKVQSALVDMAVSSLLRGGVIAVVPVGTWFLLGRRRRGELGHGLRRPVMAGSLALVVVAGLVAWQPWDEDEPQVDADRTWMSLADFLGPEVPIPAEARGLEVRGDITTDQTKRLVLSAVDTYAKSKDFYKTAATGAADLDLREPEEGDTVVALVSDRHDNIGMDQVARAIADRAGATAVYDAGDDTSVGRPWEAFSLDSVTEAFSGYDKYGVAGNHDHGSFVSSYLADRDWTMLDGTPIEGPGDTVLMGVDDPRSSGLGNWRDESGLSFTQVGDRLADAVCDAPDRVTTLLVHDANLGNESLQRGCVDLVVGGHLHIRKPASQVIGANGERGYTYTTGTTGGAAYAIAIGSKPRRDADISLITYRDGRPLGIQAVTLRTDGTYVVTEFDELDLG